MGKTSKPLTIMVPQWLAETPEFQKLTLQGHMIVIAPEADLYLGDMMWFFTKIHYQAKLLSEALKYARGGKYKQLSTDMGEDVE